MESHKVYLEVIDLLEKLVEQTDESQSNVTNYDLLQRFLEEWKQKEKSLLSIIEARQQAEAKNMPQQQAAGEKKKDLTLIKRDSQAE